MKEIKKKTWPELFQKIRSGDKNVDYRLADFEANEGDVLILEEYNPKTEQYTGQSVKKTIKKINKIDILRYYSAEDLEKFGAYLIEFEG